MNSTPFISVGAFDISIPTPLTNEIPHLSIYNILNRHLRNVWSRDFVGRSETGYTHTFESQKIVNGVKSPVYGPRNVTFTDPGTGNVYSADFEKINFSVDGALETEIDYLMHEQTRYLSKLYPDDINTLYTLTEAERQSYINEAAHMIHSYFDTEQIVSTGLEGINKNLADLYYRVRFLTGITPVRSLTGVAKQEEQLFNLLNTGNTITYSGFSIFSSANQEYVISNTKSYEPDVQAFSLDAFYFMNASTYKKKGAVKLHGKTRNDSLEDLLSNVATYVNITPETLQQNIKEFVVLETDDPLELIKDFVYGEGKYLNNFNLNDFFFKATRENWIKPGATLENLQETEFGNTVMDWKSQHRVYPLFSQDAGSRELTFFDKDDLTVINPIYLENRLITNASSTLKTFEKSYIIKLGYSQYKDSVMLALGNIIYSDLTYRYTLYEDFKLIADTVVASKDLVLTVDVKTKDGKRVFSGIFDSNYLKERNLSRIISNYTSKEFEELYDANDLFLKKSLQTRLDELVFSVRDDFVIEYKTAKLMDETYKDEVAYIEDKIGDKDYLILLTKHPDYTYNVLLNYTEQVGETLTVRGITGNTSNGQLVDAGDIAEKRGSFSFADGELLIQIDDVGSATFKVDNCFDEKHIDVHNENGDKVGQYVTGFTKYPETGANREAFVDIDLIPKIIETTKIQKLFGNLINTRFEASFEIKHEETFIDSESNIYSNIQEIPVEYFETFEEALEHNCVVYTNVVYDNTNLSDVYVYCTAYKIEQLIYNIPSSPLNKIDIARIIFSERTPDFFELKTCKCEIYSGNILKLEDDIREDVNEYGRINCLVLNTYGNFYSTRVTKAVVKNEYCYVTLEDSIDNYEELLEKNAILILDLRQKAEVKTATVLDAKRRGYDNTQTYKFKEGLRYYRKIDWEDLLRQHLTYDFNNLFSKGASTVYADNSRVSQATLVPASLSYLENLTVLDSTIAPELFKDLLEENRSLYLDSSVKILTNVALEHKMLVYTSDYDCVSYMYSTTLPSSITLYDYPNYNDYEPLREFLDELGQNPIDLEDLQKQISRRLIIWGNVVWDANNTNKTVKTLRTIWSGYFTNFKIINTDDILPPEPIVLSDLGVTAEQKQKNINICNYNFSENKGDAITDWILSTIINTSKTERIRVNVCDAFSHEELEDKTVDVTKRAGTDIFIDSFALRANRMDYDVSEDSTILKSCESYISKIRLDADIEIRHLDDSNKLIIDFDSYDNLYTFTTAQRALDYTDYKPDSRYSMKLIYNMLHLDEENFEALGFFNSFVPSTALQLFLEHCVYIYYVNHCTQVKNVADIRKRILKTNPTLQEKVIEFYRQLLFDGEGVLEGVNGIIKISDVLNYVYELYIGVNCIPCIGKLTKTGKVDLYYYMLGRTDDGKFYIYEGTSRETVNGDLLNTLLARISKSFQVSKSLYLMYLTAIYRYQAILPNKAYGLPSDLSIDTYLQANPILRDIKISSEVTDESELALKQKFLEENSEKHVSNILRNDLLNVFPSLKLADITLEEDSIKIGENRYKVAEAAKYFKEYYPATVQLSTEEEEDSGTDIDKCILQFDQDFKLKKAGYLYLTDIKAPNKRTNYSSARETQVLDRSCTLQNLHIIGYKEDDNQLKLLLQDSSATYTRFVENAMELIKPQDAEKTSQLVNDRNISLGFKWTDPGLEIGYTFYKRKFIFEGEISSADPTLIKLVDEDLKAVKEENNFSFTDHVASGDLIQIIFNTATSKYQAGQRVTFDLTQGTYYGPYKIIYSQALALEDGSYQFMLLSGPGNLVVVKVPLSAAGSIWISEATTFDTTHTHIAYLLKNGEIVYYDPSTDSTYQVARLPEFERSEPRIFLDDEPTKVAISVAASIGPDNVASTEDGICTIKLFSKASQEELYEEPLTSKHDDWYIFGEIPEITPAPSDNEFPGGDLDTGTPESKQLILKNVPTQVLTSIPLNDGFLDIDNFDRMFFESTELDDTTETSWLALPDKLEEFDASLQPHCFEKKTESGVQLIDIETASKEELIEFIRDSLNEMFNNSSTLNESIDTAALSYQSGTDAEGNPIGLDSSVLAEIAQKKKGSFTLYSGSTSDMANSAVASLLSHIDASNVIKTWVPLTGTVYMPAIQEMDIPVYFKTGEKPKWKKAYVLTGKTDTTLEGASQEDLIKLAKAVLPSRYVTRVAPNVTAYAKVKNNLVMWDQNTATITVTDKTGLLKNRIALKSLAVEHSILLDKLIAKNDGSTQVPLSYVNSNLLFAYAAATDVYNYWKAATALASIKHNDVEYNFYSIFGLNVSKTGAISYNTKAPLYLPEVLKAYKDYDWDSDSAFSANKIAIQKLMNIATDTTKYQAWLNNCLHLDFMTTAICKFESFKDIGYDLNLPLLLSICTSIADLAQQADLLQKIVGHTSVASDSNPVIVKGQPFFNVNTENQNSFVSARLTAIATNDLATKTFESLIATSGIEVSEGYVHIYGTINWPDLKAVSERARTIIRSYYQGALQAISTDVLDSVVADITDMLKVQIEENYVKFNGKRPYTAGEGSFAVTVNLNTGRIKTVQLEAELKANKQSKFLSVANAGASRIVVSADGSFDFGDEENDILSVDSTEATLFTDDDSLESSSAVVVFDALKNSGIFNTITVNPDKTLDIITNGTSVKNAEVTYSTVAYATDKEIGIQNDSIVLENGTSVTATILVTNRNKDNFQLGYGSVPNLNKVLPRDTVFEVPSAYYADFATYDNKASIRTYNENVGGYVKPSVFDLYPTFEKVSESERSKFYKLDDDGNVKYMKNGNGRYIFRISDPSSITYGSRFVGKIDPQKFSDITNATDVTVANEWVDLNFFKNVAEKANTVLLPEKRARGKNYNTLINMYSVQRIPELVDDPWFAILNYPYKIEILESKVADGSAEIKEGYLELTLNESEAVNFADYINNIKPELHTDANIETTNTKQLSDIANADAFTSLDVNVEVSKIDLKIVNPTATLPRLVAISKFISSLDDNENLVIKTTSNEIYIPEKGYGQALLGNYTTPQECQFEEGIFYKEDKKTVNKLDEQFVLVNKIGEHIKDAEGNDVVIPRLTYKSFAQANQALPIDLATKVDLDISDTLIDLSKFNIGYNSIYCNQMHLLELLDFTGKYGKVSETANEKSLSIYEVFKNRVRFSCKLLYSELPKDPTTDNTICLSTWYSENYTNTRLIAALGYTRSYTGLQIPANTRYLSRTGTYKLTNTLLARNLKAYSADVNGNLVYLDIDGKPITEPTVNKDPICAVKRSQNVALFTVTNGAIQALVTNCFYYTKACIVPKDANNMLFVKTSDSGLGSILAICDPNEAPAAYSNIQNITNETDRWESDTSFKFVFDKAKVKNLQVELVYEKSHKNTKFNMVYLKDLEGNLVAKVFFRKSIDTDNLLIFQKNS